MLLNPQNLMTYVDDSVIIQVGYQSQNIKHFKDAQQIKPKIKFALEIQNKNFLKFLHHLDFILFLKILFENQNKNFLKPYN